MKKTDIFLGLYVLVPIVFLIVPMPTVFLDVLMMLNISLALIIMFTALFSKEALQMSSFPTLLLITTLFRLSLNVSSTRNILLQGYAGNVVVLLVSSLVAVSDRLALYFMILIIIQFIVTNKDRSVYPK